MVLVSLVSVAFVVTSRKVKLCSTCCLEGFENIERSSCCFICSFELLSIRWEDARHKITFACDVGRGEQNGIYLMLIVTFSTDISVHISYFVICVLCFVARRILTRFLPRRYCLCLLVSKQK